MSISATAKKTSPQGAYERILLELAFSDSYSTGGDTVDLSKVINSEALAPVSQPTLLPLVVEPVGQALDGYSVEWIPGTTVANGKLRVWQPGGSEYVAGAYGAPFTNTPPGQVFLWVELQDADR